MAVRRTVVKELTDDVPNPPPLVEGEDFVCDFHELRGGSEVIGTAKDGDAYWELYYGTGGWYKACCEDCFKLYATRVGER